MFLQSLKQNAWINNCLLFSFFLLLSKDIFMASSLYAQINPEKLLKQGVEAYKKVDFELAVQSLEQAIEIGLEAKDKQTKAFQYLAFAQAALGDTAQSQAAYLKLLTVDPDFDLPVSASPRLREPLLQAQKIFAKRDFTPPEIVVQSLVSVESGNSFTIKAEVKDKSGIDKVTLFYRSTPIDRFSSITMTYVRGNEYSATIPAVSVQPPSFDFYIEAFDIRGNGPSLQGSVQNPLRVEVISIDKTPPEIVFKKVDTIESDSPLPITVEVTDASKVEKVTLFYRIKREENYTSIQMNHLKDDIYFAEISKTEIKSPGMEYYVEAFDREGNGPARKGSAENPLFVEVITPDRQPPQIAHTPPDKVKEGESVKMTALITDNIAIENAIVLFRKKNVADFSSLHMKKNDTNQYEVEIPGQEIMPPFIEYYITATDKAGNNGFWQNAQNPFTLPVTPLQITKPPVIAETGEETEKKKGTKKWLWMGLGAAVVGGVVIGLVGGGDGEKIATTGSIIIQVPE